MKQEPTTPTPRFAIAMSLTAMSPQGLQIQTFIGVEIGHRAECVGEAVMRVLKDSPGWSITSLVVEEIGPTPSDDVAPA